MIERNKDFAKAMTIPPLHRLASRVVTWIEESSNHVTSLSGMGSIITGIDKIAFKNLAQDYGLEYSRYKNSAIYYQTKMLESNANARENAK